MTSLDGWSLNEKIQKLQEEVRADIRDLKIQFSLLYEYLKETGKVPDGSKKKKKKAPAQKN